MNRGINGGGIDFSAMKLAEARARSAAQQQQPMMIASPFNDVQTVAMIAASLSGSAAERVKFAHEILVEAFGRNNDFMAALQAKQKALAPAVE